MECIARQTEKPIYHYMLLIGSFVDLTRQRPGTAPPCFYSKFSNKRLAFGGPTPTGFEQARSGGLDQYPPFCRPPEALSVGVAVCVRLQSKRNHLQVTAPIVVSEPIATPPLRGSRLRPKQGETTYFGISSRVAAFYIL